MKINYDLSGKNGSLPLIPVPHDCIVEHITETENAVSFEFSADVCEYDSVRAMGLNFHGPTISVNLSDPTFFIYEKKKSGSKIKEIFDAEDFRKKICGKKLEYLNHFVNENDFVVVLSDYILAFTAYSVEFDWKE